MHLSVYENLVTSELKKLNPTCPLCRYQTKISPYKVITLYQNQVGKSGTINLSLDHQVQAQLLGSWSISIKFMHPLRIPCSIEVHNIRYITLVLKTYELFKAFILEIYFEQSLHFREHYKEGSRSSSYAYKREMGSSMSVIQIILY